MYDLTSDNDRNNTVVKGTDIHNYNTPTKDTIRTKKSSTNWGLMRSTNSAPNDWNTLTSDLRAIPTRNALSKALYNKFIESNM